MPTSKPVVKSGTRLVLLAGFGGLLGLMAVGGFDAIQVLHEIQARNVQIRRIFLSRNRALEQIREALYLSGTFVRNYLLDPEPSGADVQRKNLGRLHNEIETALDVYASSLSPEEVNPVPALRTQLATYWNVLEPILHWSQQERRERGYAFLREELVPRRATVLDIADKIAAVNEQELNGGDERLEETFRRFRRRLFLMLAATLSIGLVLAGLVASRFLRLEKQAALRYEQVMRAQIELKELSARLVRAQEEERRTISRELHDEVGQSLSALLMELGNLAAVAPQNLEPLQRHLASICKLAESSVNVARNMALLLRPSMLDDFGLVPALEWHTREVSKRTGMGNCARHAEARSVRIRVRQDREHILLSIQDDGKGFDAQHIRGLGLVGMEERVNHIGGTLQVKSELGRGTLLMAELPLAAHGRPFSPEAFTHSA